jgi:hypothetical protein
MLRWSATETGRTVELRGIVDPTVDPGVLGGRELVALGRSAGARLPDPQSAQRVARALSPAAAVDAAAVAGAFELYNRVVDATGLPVGKGARRELADIIDTLGLDRMPHAHH